MVEKSEWVEGQNGLTVGKVGWSESWKAGRFKGQIGWKVGKSERQNGWKVGLVGQLEWMDSEKVRMVEQLDSCNGWTGQIAG
jgi:hypothetical protein